MKYSNPITSSSNVINLAYDDVTNILTVTYSRGDVYDYYGVPKIVYLQVLGAASVGKTLKSLVEKRFPYTRG